MTQPSASPPVPTSRIRAAALLLVLGLGAAAGSPAHAQDPLGISIIRIGDRDTSTLGIQWINREDCESDAEVVFQLRTVPNRPTIDLYRGANCNTREARGGASVNVCDFLATFEVTAAQNFQVALGAATLLGTCDPSASKPSIWFLAVSASNSGEEVTAAEFGVKVLDADTAPPSAPTNVRGGSGQNSIPVRWTAGGQGVGGFEIYAHSGGFAGDAGPAGDAGSGVGMGTRGACDAGPLVPGEDAQELGLTPVRSVGSRTATESSLSAADINGDVAAVAVVALDEAGNRSPLSEVTCLYVVPTTGFRDLYEAENGPIPQGCPCSAGGSAQLQGSFPIALAVAALAYRSRRRRS